MTTETTYRDDLPAVPERMRERPIGRGYPIPWFVPFIKGKPEFRAADQEKLVLAIKQSRCWLCGHRLEKTFVFVIGPMCCINRVSAEPPCHVECARFSVVACPFLIGKEPERRETNMPSGTREAPGMMIRRNPGVTLLWHTTSFQLNRVQGGVLFQIGNPSALEWWSKGRKATRAEVEESIRTGLPILTEAAMSDGPKAVAALEKMRAAAERLLPAA